MTDILLDNNQDLIFANGDFSPGESTSQEVESIITSFQGWWKEFPLIGCAAPSYLNSPGSCENLRRQIQIQLISDAKQVTTFSYFFNANGTLVINVNGLSIIIIP